MSELGVHPVAALFPMLADEELDELAADIKARGLLQPIVLDPEGRILDGRNRLAACGKAGIKPDFVTYADDDPDGYALAVNINRRHLSKGQRAMAVAKVYPEPEQGKRSTSLKIKEVGINGGALSQARTVLRVLPKLADAVIAGAPSLNDAYAQAMEHEKTTAETKRIRRASNPRRRISMI